MGCQGSCKGKKGIRNEKFGWYAKGIKRCTTCELFFKTENIFCNCCNAKFRVRPKVKKSRRK